jgi:hypothetical protein
LFLHLLLIIEQLLSIELINGQDCFSPSSGGQEALG